MVGTPNGMDLDPELDVTLSDGQRAVTFQIMAVGVASEAWAVVEPQDPFRIVRSRTEALEARQRLDLEIAAHSRMGAGRRRFRRNGLGPADALAARSGAADWTCAGGA